MEQSKIDFFVANNSDKLPSDKMAMITEKMKTMTDDKFALLSNVRFTSPTLVWVVSFFFGYLGIDRFLVGSVGAGVGKLLTFGGFGIWWLIDLFIISGMAKENNFKKISSFLI
ncbi:MAG: TM2 domain-containing protein [Paludibacteraceae bacterium]|nr:TM2 domain-containing protein [Paludibacteraceae bacterium]